MCVESNLVTPLSNISEGGPRMTDSKILKRKEPGLFLFTGDRSTDDWFAGGPRFYLQYWAKYLCEKHANISFGS